ncbi:Acetyl-CoA carboxylase 1 [Acorus gramineus]|uniref:Acetyl-CoA carboxylase 1 n=1 Tax=Acorus gramineus TaxID=55184 RepID=A0AAV9AUF2_ACOGR|nr:Acetyl-CoA carboxylase 1 [Acorus gramineus]
MSESQRKSVMGDSLRINGFFNGKVALRHQAALSEVDEFCMALGGKTPIHSILIANNGMAAVKFMRSVRTWAYETFGTEKAILLVAMATPEDMRINAEHIRIADQFVEVPGGTNNNNYANVQLIVEMAEITRVSAVWPGWGHASENPELPDALDKKGIIFLGPPAMSMAALGDKIGSSLIAQAAGVPTLPWSGSHVKISSESCLDCIPDDIYRQACVYTTEEAVASCQVVGYPAMIKASWGGGGKGIRKVHNDDEVKALFKQVQGEVPGSPIFIMKVASQIIEEGPITVAPIETVKQLEQAARRLAKCVNYVGAATVEYLYSMETGEYYFLELNPRLQVEHPVTEWIAEINLPAAQVAVGMGIPLWQIPEIRRFYGMDHGGGYDSWKRTSIAATPFDFDEAESVRPKGHCVAVRVTSEDPDDGFKPTSGKVQELSFKSKPNVWAYFSVKSGGGIHEFSDSQFGHVFAFGESRVLAIANMVLGLKEIQIRGEIRTNVDYTIDLLNASEYRDNKIHTGWLDSRIAMRVRAERPPWYLSVVGGALYKASTSSAALVSDYVGYLEKGQIPPKHISLVNSQVTLNIDGSKYTIEMVRGGPGSYRLKMNESEIETENDHDPSKLVAETPCKLLRFLVPDGSHVDADAPYAEVEVMKMCMPLMLPASGFIHFVMSEGQAMQAGDLIARLDLDDLSAVRKAEPFNGCFPVLGLPTAVSGKVHQRCAASLNSARMILAGYEHNIDEVVQDLLSCLDSPELPFLQWQECMAVLATRLPKDLRNEADVIEQLRLQYKKDLIRVLDIVLSHQLALKASQLLEQTKLSELRTSIARSLSELEMFTEEGELVSTPRRKSAIDERMEDLVGAPLAVEDALIALFDHSDHTLQRRVVETYIRRLYQPYLVKGSVRMQWHRAGLLVSWEFSEEHIQKRNGSDTLISEESMVEKHCEKRWGAMVIIKTLQFLPTAISAALKETARCSNLLASQEMMSNGSPEPIVQGNMLHVALVGYNNPMSMLQDSGDEDQAQERINKLAKILKQLNISSTLREAGVGVVSCIIQRDEGRTPMRHSFDWSSEKLHYEEEPLLRHLEPPLSTFLELDKLKGYQNIQYTPSRDRQWHLYTVQDKPPIQRMFLRTLVRQSITTDGFFVGQGQGMELAQARPELCFTSLSILRNVEVTVCEEESIVNILEELARKIHEYAGVRMHRLAVCEWEVKLWLASAGLASGAWRVVVTNVTGHTCTVHIYRELEDSKTHEVVYHSAISEPGPLHGVPVTARYQSLGVLDRKRLVARKNNTTYCYDFPLAFQTALRQSWEFHEMTNKKANDKASLKVKELMFANKQGAWGTPLTPVNRPPAANDVESSVIAHELRLETGEIRWVIETIVGKEDGLGVENLTGSGAIAGAYSRAYNETFTLTYVTGRTVGIGAYLARLGMRCIQRLDQPIILTGFSALNKLLGREVYSSHMQLGGPKIMATNGVVHLTVSDDLEGISAILKWLSYVPRHIGGPLPIVSSLDPPERPVEYLPENSCDPRAAICGVKDNGRWLGGVFDKDSFVETLEGWARTVVTGRAKLGGIPVGIVAVETQTVMQIIPADPGQLDSHERVVPQAGQVWFPDSATKTAQAILDFNREELPLFILANWRGFSGGQRDLFEGILQAGSTIVENLRTYKQPVFVYIPMMGELRGGAWVVVDSKINPEHIEMYAERMAKGNVLEPEGMIEIKFRSRELLECMGRLDPQLIGLKLKLQDAKSGAGEPNTVEALQHSIRAREKLLLPVYTQIATRFAELHDTSLRMAAKGVIKKVVDWGSSRSFFYKRLHRRVSEGCLVSIVRDAAGKQLSHKAAVDLIKKWFLASNDSNVWEDDEAFFAWKNDPKNYEEFLQELRLQKITLQMSALGDSALDLQALPQGLASLLQKVHLRFDTG